MKLSQFLESETDAPKIGIFGISKDCLGSHVVHLDTLTTLTSRLF